MFRFYLVNSVSVRSICCCMNDTSYTWLLTLLVLSEGLLHLQVLYYRNGHTRTGQRSISDSNSDSSHKWIIPTPEVRLFSGCGTSLIDLIIFFLGMLWSSCYLSGTKLFFFSLFLSLYCTFLSLLLLTSHLLKPLLFFILMEKDLKYLRFYRAICCYLSWLLNCRLPFSLFLLLMLIYIWN